MNKEARRLEGTENENHASFLARFELKVTPDELLYLDMAYDFAKRAHEKQFRETGARYFEHVRAAAIILVDELGITDVELVIAELLHDCPEDTWLLTLPRIRLIFGERVARIDATVTKPSKDDPRFKTKAAAKRWYYASIKASDVDDKLAKLADRLQNTRALGACSREKQLRKIAETRKYILPLILDIAKKYPRIAQLLIQKFADAIAALE
jgi:GTP pyrophosphokinase